MNWLTDPLGWMLDKARAAVCWAMGHKLREEPHGGWYCERCKRHLTQVP